MDSRSLRFLQTDTGWEKHKLKYLDKELWNERLDAQPQFAGKRKESNLIFSILMLYYAAVISDPFYIFKCKKNE